MEYISIPTDVFDALIRIRIPGEARQVLDFIIRKTYTYEKTEGDISISQLSEATGLSKIATYKALKKLTQINIITKKGNGITQKGNTITQKGNTQATHCFNEDFSEPLPKKVIGITQKGNTQVTYCFNEDFSKWKPLPKKVMGITQKGNTQITHCFNEEKISTSDNIYNNIYIYNNNKKNINNTNAKKTASSPTPEQALNEWLEELARNPAYTGIDVKRLWHKMCAWCDVNGKKPTKRRFINWLNREERPLFTSPGVNPGVDVNKGAIDYSKYK